MPRFSCLFLLAFLSVQVPSGAMAQETVPQITVTGEGRVAAVPDMATITLGVSAQNSTAAAAMDEASDITQKIFDTLPGFGIEPVDVQTSELSLSPLWDNRQTGQEEPRIRGYQASNRVMVRVRDLDGLGDVLDAVLGAGANRMDGLSFGVADPAPLLSRARQRAVADARARAETYAGAAGVSLGPVLAISETGGAGPVPQLSGMAMARAEAVPVAAGETEIRAQVTVRYAIAE